MAIPLVFSLLLLSTPLSLSSSSAPHSNFPTVCIIGSGIAGCSVSHFLRQYSYHGKIHIFERNGIVGGRMATVSVTGDTFEAGASILHPKNYHALNFTKHLNLKIKEPSSANSFSLGIWNSHKFIFKTLNSKSKIPLV